MKVFVNKAYGEDCGGLVVVAANSPEEAHGALMSRYNNNPGKKWYHSYYEIVYKSENWIVLDDVRANVNTPQVLAEDSYVEY